MGTRSLQAALAALALVCVTSLAARAGDEPVAPTGHKFELAKQYYGQCAGADEAQFDTIRPYLEAFADIEVMAATMADPARFSRLMAVVNDPHTIHVMSKCATEPVMWETWMRGLTDFDKMTRATAYLANPNVYFGWMMAPMQPASWQPMLRMAQPEYFNRWMTALTNPVFYQPITSLADPGWYAPRIAWMTNPQSMRPLFGLMSPGRTAAPVAFIDGAQTGDTN